MSSRQYERKAAFEALSKGAYLDVLLPKTSGFDAASLVESGSAEELAKLPTRRTLFFDEKTRILLVLRTGASEEDVRQLLPDLEINAIAHATDAVPSSSGHAASVAGKHDIATCKVAGTDGVLVTSSSEHTYVIWNITIHLTRPRARLHRPAVYFTAAISLAISRNTPRHENVSNIMTPYQSSPRNVLEPLANTMEFRDKQIHLAEGRITKVAPSTISKDDSARPIRGATKRAFPIMPAVFARVRFNSLPDGVIASLHLETPTVVPGMLEVSAVDVKALDKTGKSGGRNTTDARLNNFGVIDPTDPVKTVTCLTDAMLPLKLSAGDEQVLLYQIAAENVAATLAVNIQVVVNLEEGSQVELVINPQAKIDAKAIADDTIYQWSRSTPKAVDGGVALPPRTRSLPSHAKISNTPPTQISGDDTDGSVSFLISAPDTVALSQSFSLKIKCINHSTRERSFSFHSVQQKPAVLRAHAKTTASKREDLTIPLLDRRDMADVFYHTPVVKSGAVRATASCEVAISLSPCVLGVLNLGQLRIVDLDDGQMVEVKDLPDIVCLEADEANATTEDVRTILPPVDAEAERKDNEFLDMVHASWEASEGTLFG
ncbi:hypothetical protein LTR78_007829 [Recurvomyces mirabilis]|uniref:Trafficking protein particle complex II-specific subunit 65 IgD3 domain-containing protein n=1 Tax=Recurvomyces mirabilis TaxID=574656 RepID=A0AAE0TTX0_9PEZI|nr:hypothetical protein LTR78_007829 [Recurvomyces mirabilis]KAK5160129.1 hypothetical protein LTS14_002236 [Recurvomyces mirabilis]